MKKNCTLIGIFLLSTICMYSQNFTKGNLVVFKVGKGSAFTDTLTSAGFPVSLDEYTQAGVYVRSLAMPTTISGANRRLITSGNANTEGQLTRSADKNYFLVPGYDTIPESNRLSINNSVSSSVNRVVGIIGVDASINTATALNLAVIDHIIGGQCILNVTQTLSAGSTLTVNSGKNLVLQSSLQIQ